MAKTKLDKLADLQSKKDQIEAQIQAIKQQENAEERKKDTRRKILIGGAVLAKLKRNEWPQKQLLDLLDGELTANRDRALFDGLTLKPSDAKPEPKKPTGAPNGGNRS
jgi:hypothetical protein